jgi:hypothetical protein
MNRLSLPRKIRVLELLVNGNSLGAVCRLANVSLNAVTKLLLDVGRACSDYQDCALRDLPCKHIELNEIWSFQRNSPQFIDLGHVWTWTAFCADTKLVLSWFVGPRDSEDLDSFASEVAGRLANRVQLTYGGGRIYLDAVASIFGVAADSAHITQAHRRKAVTPGNPKTDGGTNVHPIGGANFYKGMRYVPRRTEATRVAMRQSPISSSYARRIMGLEHSVSLHCMFYNFGQLQEDLQITPAMAAGVSNHCWSLDEIAQLGS